MSARAYRSGCGGAGRWLRWISAALLFVLLHRVTYAGQTPGVAQAAGAGQRVPLDRVVAVVNGDLILESDVEAEQRFAAFQPFSEPGTSRDQLIERLIDRALIM